MKIMNCPLNGPRNISEFVYGGNVTDMPEPSTCSEREWAAYLFMEENKKGIVKEWWMHVATSYWFIVERNTASNEIIKTYPAAEVYKQRVNFQARES